MDDIFQIIVHVLVVPSLPLKIFVKIRSDTVSRPGQTLLHVDGPEHFRHTAQRTETDDARTQGRCQVKY